MPELAPGQPPPPDYYAANVRLVISHVQETCGDLLDDAEAAHCRAILEASEPAQRLYARLLGRSRPWVRIDKLRYREIENTAAAIAELVDRGLVAVNPSAPADALLTLLTAAERQALFPGIATASKPRWIAVCIGRYPDLEIHRRMAARHSWVSVTQYANIRLFQLLFFGDEQQDLSTFVLEDLGLVRYERYPIDAGTRQFADRAALERYLALRRLRHLSSRIAECPALADWLSSALWQPAATFAEARHRDRALNRLGHWFERRRAIDEALCCYARSRSHPSRERRVRLLERLGDVEGGRALVQRIRDAPVSAEEEDFADRRLCAGRRPDAGIEQTRVPLAEAPVDRIESHAARLLGAAGGIVWHLENRFPLTLAGLAYWDTLFAAAPGAFLNPYQNAPLDLMRPEFRELRAPALRARHAELARPGAFAAALQRTYRSKHGIANRLVGWSAFTERMLDTTLACIPHPSLAAIARYVIENLFRARNGFPDLVVIYDRGRYEFVEVKGPTDQLQPAQRIWFKALNELGEPARVLKFEA